MATGADGPRLAVPGEGTRKGQESAMKLGFIGLGKMGSAMAGSLLDAGHELAVYNRTRERAEPLRLRGARVAATPKDAAHDAEAVLTMLADDGAVELVTFGYAGVLSGLAPGAVHVSCSTISVALSERLAAAHAAERQGYVAAPVFGRPEAAATKQLWVLAAGPRGDVNWCAPALEAMGRGVVRLGESAKAANIVKLAGNFVLASMSEALGEAFALTRKAGVQPDAFLDVFVSVFARSPAFERYARSIARGAYEPAGFKARLGLKDLRLALAAGDASGVPMPLASVVHDSLRAAVAQGSGELDWSVIARLAAERAGLGAAR
jgi:3-hydroxyisobutyrate dehydrogenase-like beta-hydroxyacid dehydrogenase